MPITPPMTVTAVDPATNQLTIAGHGLNTGDGFLGVYAPDGGTLPAPLVGTSDYWAIRVDANTIRLASSSSNAMVGTAIGITSAGSGTLQLVKGLPYRRPRVAAPLTQVFSADNNATWESLEALWNLLTGQAQSIWTGIKLAANQHVAVSGTGRYKHGTFTLQFPGQAFTFPGVGSAWPGYVTSGMASRAHVAPIILPLGARLLAARVYLSDRSSPQVTARFRVHKNVPSAGLDHALATSPDSAGTGAYQMLSVAGLTETIASGTFYSLWTLLSGGTTEPITVHGAEVDYDMP